MRLEDWLFGETDDSCAICGIKGCQIHTVHHIDGNHSNNVYDNTIVLCHNCHNRYHQDKGITDEEIANRKRHLIQKTLTQYGLSAMKIADRNEFGVVAMPFLLYHLVQLGYMEKQETQMTYSGGERTIEVTARFTITETGKATLRKWFS